VKNFCNNFNVVKFLQKGLIVNKTSSFFIVSALAVSTFSGCGEGDLETTSLGESDSETTIYDLSEYIFPSETVSKNYKYYLNNNYDGIENIQFSVNGNFRSTENWNLEITDDSIKDLDEETYHDRYLSAGEYSLNSVTEEDCNKSEELRVIQFYSTKTFETPEDGNQTFENVLEVDIITSKVCNDSEEHDIAKVYYAKYLGDVYVFDRDCEVEDYTLRDDLETCFYETIYETFYIK
jgi:hypothetical protein